MRQKYSDQQIIETIKTGNNNETLKFLYKRCFPKIKAYICTNSGTQDDALDIFQDAVLALCKQVMMNKYNEKYEIDGFIYSVSRNLWINKSKREQRKINLENFSDQIDNSDDFSDYIITRENEHIINTILEKLGRKCVELLKFSIFYKITNREICKKMSFTSEDAVKTQKYKCKQKLIKIMDEFPVVKELID